MSADRRLVLVLGGARSGKSAYAEALAAAHIGPLVYVATAEPGDTEMAERIAEHRSRRGEHWRTEEALLALEDTIEGANGPERFLLVDCVTLWLSNLMHADEDIDARVERLCATLDACHGTVVLVSNEVGLGIVPDNALARRFRDVAGRANQRLAQSCDEVVFLAAGLPMTLKPQPGN